MSLDLSRRTILVDSANAVVETNEVNNFATANYWYSDDLNHCIH